ncbi:MAG: hypothetical protein JW814_07420 [Candidatus Krumholzibacteriota bacterium]|nr:hypothetical protein [Candidatus Krumholzibacteriota bacterium]
MVLLNPAANRGAGGQEIRADLQPEQAARLNNPNPGNRVVRIREAEGSTPPELRNSAKKESRRRSPEDTVASREGMYDEQAQHPEPEEEPGAIIDQRG